MSKRNVTVIGLLLLLLLLVAIQYFAPDFMDAIKTEPEELPRWHP